MLKMKYVKYIIFLIVQFMTINLTYAYKINNLEPRFVNDKIGFYDEESNQHFLEEFESEIVLLVFWAKWNISCSKEMSDLNLLQKDFKKLPFRILTISVDYKNVQEIKDFFINRGLSNIKMYFDYKNCFMKSFNVTTMPTAFLIAQEGNLLMSFAGSINWCDEEIRKIILSHMPECGIGNKINCYK